MNDLIFKPKIPKVYNPIWLENPLKIITEEEEKIFKSLNIEPLGVINEFILNGGRITGKTTDARDYCMYRLISEEGANIVVTRAEQNDIRGSVFAGFEKLIYKITNNKPQKYFKISKSPFEITFKPNGNKIFFLAINKDINRTKGFEIPKGYIAVVWHEECNEMESEEYLESAKMTFLRFFNKTSKILYAYNIEQLRTHWSNIYFPQKIAKREAIRVYSTWKDIAKLLDPATIAKILEDRARDIEFYRYWYLGHIIGLKGLVFRQFNRKKHVVKQLDIQRIMEYVSTIIVSIDAANKNDATAVGALCILRDGRIIILDSFYYDPLEKGQLDDVEMSRLICNWWVRFSNRFPTARYVNTMGIVDNANWNLKEMLQGSQSMGYFAWYTATDKVILRDTKRLQNMFGADLILFYCPNDSFNDNKYGILEIESYIYDEKTQEIKKGQQDHFIDMLKYGTYPYQYPQLYYVDQKRR